MDFKIWTLDQLCQQAYGAYQYLHANDLSQQSGTSKRLRAGDVARLRARLAEELLELRGVIEGTHRHEGFDQDIILEGYEVFYWAVCVAVASQYSYEAVQPAKHLTAGFEAIPTERLLFLAEFDRLAARMQNQAAISDVAQAFYLIGCGCALNSTPPARLIERDLLEMRQKNYLAAYWGQGSEVEG